VVIVQATFTAAMEAILLILVGVGSAELPSLQKLYPINPIKPQHLDSQFLVHIGYLLASAK
jgi:hypothetical protein